MFHDCEVFYKLQNFIWHCFLSNALTIIRALPVLETFEVRSGPQTREKYFLCFVEIFVAFICMICLAGPFTKVK